MQSVLAANLHIPRPPQSHFHTLLTLFVFRQVKLFDNNRRRDAKVSYSNLLR